MKKILSILLLVALVFSSLSILSFAEGETSDETDFVRFTTDNFNPYGVFNFSSNGNNASINPDTVKYAVVKYRTITADTELGVELIGQLYTEPTVEPYVPINYVHSQKWESTVVDLTTVGVTRNEEEDQSVWNSGDYEDTSKVRFDMLEPNMASEKYEAGDNNENYGIIRNKSQIDIAWIAFFENEADAKAYTGKESTPYCILDVESLSHPVLRYNVSFEVYKNNEKQASEELEEIEVNVKGNTHHYALNGKEVEIKTFTVPEGYVMKNVNIRSAVGECEVYVDVYEWKGDLESSMKESPITSLSQEHTGNEWLRFDFGSKLRYGKEYLLVLTSDTTGFGYWIGDPMPADSGWVVYHDGEVEETEVPLVLYTLDYVGVLPEETATPTPEPTATETPEPTATPTDEPAATEEPATEATAAPTEAPKSSGCGSVIGTGSIFGIVVLAGCLLLKKKSE